MVLAHVDVQMLWSKAGRWGPLRPTSQQAEHLHIGVKLFMLKVVNTAYVGAVADAIQLTSSEQIWVVCP